MLDILTHSVAGMIMGMVTGLLPGIGPSVILLGSWPLLMQSSLPGLFAFYIVLLITSQYFGSISAILYGVMGEITSVPAVNYGHAMTKSGRGVYALRYTAYASLIASMVALVLCVVPFLYTDVLTSLMTGQMRIGIITVMFVMLIWTNQHKWLTLALIGVGVLLGIVGYNNILQRHLIVDTYSGLDAGIPFAPLMVGFLVLPLLIAEIRKGPDSVEYSHTYRGSPKHAWMPGWFMIRGSLVGFFTGLIPGVSYTISSNLAAALERRWHPNSKIRPLIAAEAANNSAAISAILPMLIFALPIVPSEVLLLNLAEMSGYTSAMARTAIAQHWPAILISVLMINLLIFWIARSSYQLIARLYQATKNHIYMVILIIIVIITIFFGGKYDDGLTIIVTMTLGNGLGLLIRDFNAKAAGMIGFILSDQYLSDIYRLLLIQGII